MSARIFRAEEPKLSVDVEACLLPAFGGAEVFTEAPGGDPLEGGM